MIDIINFLFALGAGMSMQRSGTQICCVKIITYHINKKWWAKIVVTCTKFGHFLPTEFYGDNHFLC